LDGAAFLAAVFFAAGLALFFAALFAVAVFFVAILFLIRGPLIGLLTQRKYKGHYERNFHKDKLSTEFC
jgi:predicted membrane protein